MKVSRRRTGAFYFLSLISGVLLSLATASPAAAKELSGRFGMGATNIGPGSYVPALSIDWQLTEATGIEFNLGLDTRATSNSFLLGLRYSRNLYIENQQFYYLYMGAGLLTLPNEAGKSAGNAAGYAIEGGAGAKFFLDNLPNLGIDLGAGFRLDSPASIRIHTVAFAGFHYYF